MESFLENVFAPPLPPILYKIIIIFFLLFYGKVMTISGPSAVARGLAPHLRQAMGPGAAATQPIISMCYPCTKLIGGGGSKNRSLGNYLFISY